ncbi:MAG: pseudouridine synthase [Treponema sp.]|nr:pseudouridine synthase [Treponema sp.]
MKPEFLTPKNLHAPEVIFESADFFIAYKPPKMHSAPGSGPSLAEWCALRFPEINKITGRGGYGLLHRLDYETHGLLLFARNQKSFDMFTLMQERGEVIKEYGVLAAEASGAIAGFPPFTYENPGGLPPVIASQFRPYGPGRKEVRPCAISGLGKNYSTVILKNNICPAGSCRYMEVRIEKGFRHQIRCHLAWAGFPVLNDPLYGGKKAGVGFLGLRAASLRFTDPGTEKELFYTLPELDFFDI